MSIERVVQVTIQAGTVNPARAGFGVPLILAFHDAWANDEVRVYETFTQVQADFPATDANKRHVNLMAQAAFNQNPRPEQLKIGRLPTPPSSQLTVLDGNNHPTGTAIVGSVVSPDGTVTAINVPWDTDLATTLGDLDTAIDAIAGLTCGLPSGGAVVVTTDTPGQMAFFEFGTLAVRDTTADWDYDDRLTALLLVDPTFYAVFIDNNSAINIDKVARWAETNERLAFFGPQVSDPSQFTGDFALAADYTALQANDAAVGLFVEEPRSTFKEVGWACGILPKDPGSVSWALKSIGGAGVDAWTPSERSTIEGLIGNTYTNVGGSGRTWEGKTFGGEWIDIVRGIAWMDARMGENTFAVMAAEDKVPYTDGGIRLLAAEVEAVLQLAEDRQVIDAGWTVTIPTVAQQTASDRQNRILRGLEFEARAAGAIHNVRITGTVTF